MKSKLRKCHGCKVRYDCNFISKLPFDIDFSRMTPCRKCKYFNKIMPCFKCHFITNGKCYFEKKVKQCNSKS